MIVFHFFLFFLVIITVDGRNIKNVKPIGENILYEGDILLPKKNLEIGKTSDGRLIGKLKSEPARRRNLIVKDLSLRWTFPIPYHINKDVNKSAVLAGIAKWEQETCARFVRKNDTLIGNGLNFIKGKGCWARLGKEGTTPQEISIDVNCESLGTVTHEIAHAFGFVHEHKHFKRDDYIVVQYENINSTQWFNFDIELESMVEDFGIGYDYGSVMHYRGNSFTKNKNLTILTVDPNYQDTIGQEVGPSFADVKKLNFAYCNSTCPNTLNCRRGGYVNPNNCNRCKCPEGFGGQLCEKVAVNVKACGASNLTATKNNQFIKAAGAKTCYYLIEAPTNKRVFFNLTKKSFPNYWQCAGGYVEINYNGDFTLTGARYCFYEPTVSHSKHEELLVIYKGAEDSEFALSYSYDDPASASRVTNTEKTGCAVPKKTMQN